ncbi:MAG: TatD family hydrolase [Paludibacter sp.]
MFVDIHTHKSNKSEFPSIRNLAFQEAIIVFSSPENGLFSIGIHPWNAHEFSDNDFSELRKWLTDSRFVVIGECGLDKNSEAVLESQISVFKKHIILSEEFQKPLLIHCVGCFNDLMMLRKEMNPKQLWIIHGFRGKPELAQQILKSGCALSFGEYFNEESVRLTPIDKLYVETDESSLPVEEIYGRIATVKNLSPELLTAGEVLYNQFITTG